MYNEVALPMAAAKSRLQTAIEVILPVSYRCLHWFIGAMLTAASTFFIPADSPGIAGGIILASVFLFLIVAGTVLMMELGFPYLKRGLAIALTSAAILIAVCLAFGTLQILEFTLALFVATLSLYLISRILFVSLFVSKDDPPFRVQLIVDRIVRSEYRSWL